MIQQYGNETIYSVGYSDEQILRNISQLHNNNNPFDLDPCFNKGAFYGNYAAPKLKFDLQAIADVQANVTHIPLKDASVSSIVFDPPFMFGHHGQTKNNIMNKRFTMFDNYKQLESMYKSALTEFRRILKSKGIVALKCQDYTDSVTTLTHCFVWDWAIKHKFYVKDLFILVGKHRIHNPNLIQRHARKNHCYWFVLERK